MRRTRRCRSPVFRDGGQQVWHGTAQAEIDPRRINVLAIRSAVDQMLEGFPARSGVAEQR
jgi:hypothetical protein